jgi:hypothetical protein
MHGHVSPTRRQLMMTRTIRRTTTDHPDALTCRAAVLLLRVDPKTALTDEETVTHLHRLLRAVSLELEADRESLPATVRCAAVHLADHIVRRSSIPVPSRPADAGGSTKKPGHGADHATGIPFRRSIRLGRMG